MFKLYTKAHVFKLRVIGDRNFKTFCKGRGPELPVREDWRSRTVCKGGQGAQV